MGGSELFDHNENAVDEGAPSISPKSSTSVNQENSCNSNKKLQRSTPSDKSTSMASSITSTPF